jgi:hypothetical protein
MANVSGFTAACTTNKNKSTVDLAWTASPDAYVTGYTIVRTNTATGASAPVAVPSGRGTVSVVDTAPTNAGDAYTYTIRAVAAGTSWTTPLLTATGVPTYTKNACTTA